MRAQVNSESYELVTLVAKLMSGFQQLWFVIGGWAIDLHLGNVSRKHEDIEISIFRHHQKQFYQLLKNHPIRYLDPVGNNPIDCKSYLWKSEYLDLPIHQLRTKINDLELDIMLTEGNDQDWVFRRNNKISLKLDRAILYKEIDGIGVKYLAPEVILLFKSKYKREKDLRDLEIILPLLDNEARIWLCNNIKMINGVEDPWLSRINYSTEN